jgi:hypothetical protein
MHGGVKARSCPARGQQERNATAFQYGTREDSYVGLPEDKKADDGEKCPATR